MNKCQDRIVFSVFVVFGRGWLWKCYVPFLLGCLEFQNQLFGVSKVMSKACFAECACSGYDGLFECYDRWCSTQAL